MRSRNEVIHLQPIQSRFLTLWLGFIHCLALVGVWQIRLNLDLKLLLILAVTFHLAWLVHRHLMGRSRHAVIEAMVTGDGVWQLTLGNGEKLQAELLPDSFIKPWLIILNFKSATLSPVKNLILFPDSLDNQLARRLRIYLRQSGVDRKGLFSGG